MTEKEVNMRRLQPQSHRHYPPLIETYNIEENLVGDLGLAAVVRRMQDSPRCANRKPQMSSKQVSGNNSVRMKDPISAVQKCIDPGKHLRIDISNEEACNSKEERSKEDLHGGLI